MRYGLREQAGEAERENFIKETELILKAEGAAVVIFGRGRADERHAAPFATKEASRRRPHSPGLGRRNLPPPTSRERAREKQKVRPPFYLFIIRPGVPFLSRADREMRRVADGGGVPMRALGKQTANFHETLYFL